jgi:putative transposase
MPQGEDISLIGALATVVAKERVEFLSRVHGFVYRVRKTYPYLFVWTLVFGFTAGQRRSLADLERLYEEKSGESMAGSSFYEKFNAGLVGVLRALVLDAIRSVTAAEQRLEGLLAPFRDVLIADTMLIRLRDTLQTLYPGTRTNHSKASLKLSSVFSVTAQGPQNVKLAPGRAHDGKLLTVGAWVRGSLLLIDLGYYSFSLFSRVVRNGGSFISRLKETANPLIKGSKLAEAVPGALVGKKLQEVIATMAGQMLDLLVEVSVTHRAYRGKQSKKKETFRVVGIWNEAESRHHLYITSIPPELLSAHEIAQVYAARWSIELFFRELAAAYRIKEIPSGNVHIVESLIYAGLLTVLVSRKILALLVQRANTNAHRLRPERLAAALGILSQAILSALSSSVEALLFDEEAALRYLLNQTIDPHKSRTPLLARVTTGTQLQYMTS